MSDEKIDVLAVMNFLADEAAHAALLSRFDEEAHKFGKAASDAVKAHAAVAELIEAASEMNRLAKGPTGGVSQADKRATVDRMTAALARVRSS